MEAVSYERYRSRKAGSQQTGVSKCGRWVVSQQYAQLVDDCERYVAAGGGGRDSAADPTVAAELDVLTARSETTGPWSRRRSHRPMDVTASIRMSSKGAKTGNLLTANRSDHALACFRVRPTDA